MFVHHAVIEHFIFFVGVEALSIEDKLFAFASVVVGALVINTDGKFDASLTRLDANSC